MFDSTMLSPPDTSTWEENWELELEELKAALTAREAEISRLRAEQAALVRTADRLQADLAYGQRCMVDWLVSVLDVSTQTARRLLNVAKSEDEVTEAAMRQGVYGLDRADLLCRLRRVGAPEEVFRRPLDFSLGHLYRLHDQLREFDREDETAGYEDRYLVLQPSLDQARLRFWGETSGVDAEILKRAVERRESELPVLPHQTRGQRNVDALVAICTDSLTTQADSSGGQGRPVTVAEVFVDAATAAGSRGSRGARLASGPRVGPRTLEEILCHGRIRVIVVDEVGKPIRVTTPEEAIPAAIRQHVWWRDQARCQIDECPVTQRLEIHHIRPRSEGGTHDPENLTLACWYHHHVAIHMLGMRIDPASPPHRRRLLPLYSHGPPTG